MAMTVEQARAELEAALAAQKAEAEAALTAVLESVSERFERVIAGHLSAYKAVVVFKDCEVVEPWVSRGMMKSGGQVVSPDVVVPTVPPLEAVAALHDAPLPAEVHCVRFYEGPIGWRGVVAWASINAPRSLTGAVVITYKLEEA